MTKKANDQLLTKAELELMNVVWDRDGATVRIVVDALPKSRKLAYTSVATFMKILEKKNVLKSKTVDRVLTYSPILLRTEYESRSVNNLVQNVFKGTPSALVSRLISDADFSPEELKDIRRAINERVKS